MKKEYGKIVLAAAFLAVAGFCYGWTRWQQGTLLPAAQTIAYAESGPAGQAGQTNQAGETGLVGQETSMAEEPGWNVSAPEAETTTEAVCYVHVCGEVAVPGVYVLPEDSRIFEAIEAAGGFTDAAAREVLNLAGRISDGMQIVVISEEEAEILQAEESAKYAGNVPETAGIGGSSSGRVNLNTATKEELMTLNGIGAAKAEEIIRYREEAGGFQAIEDIMKVPGIKNAGFQKIKDSITV